MKELVAPGDALGMVIALGYGETAGSARKSKEASDVIGSKGTVPDWFQNGIEAALKAPTAMNQQKFVFGMKDGQPAAKIKGMGPYTKVDLGIVAYHFEVGSGRKVRGLAEFCFLNAVALNLFGANGSPCRAVLIVARE